MLIASCDEGRGKAVTLLGRKLVLPSPRQGIALLPCVVDRGMQCSYTLVTGRHCCPQICVAIYLSTTPYPEIVRYDQEKKFFTSKTKKQTGEFPFGKFKSQDSVKLSVIVPAYNEEERCKLVSEFLFEQLASIIWCISIM